jgi:hypothetical protein
MAVLIWTSAGLVETHLRKRRSRHGVNLNDDEYEYEPRSTGLTRVSQQQFTRDGQISSDPRRRFPNPRLGIQIPRLRQTRVFF